MKIRCDYSTQTQSDFLADGTQLSKILCRFAVPTKIINSCGGAVLENNQIFILKYFDMKFC